MDTYPASKSTSDTDLIYHHLNLVSRSFSLTIKFMDQPLCDYVCLAYLLCRIVDTVEDDSVATIEDKISWLSDISFLAGDDFNDRSVLAMLQQRALTLCEHGSAPDDFALLKDFTKIVDLFETYPEPVHKVICHGVSILANGMSASLRRSQDNYQINSLDEVDSYCYSVAGVVGEMLSELFCIFEPKIDHKEILDLSVSFGEGLQLTNILRDRAKDEQRGASFLPASTADEVKDFVSLTQGHLDDAIDFISLLPIDSCKGIRLFCFTNVAMAMYLLRQVQANPLDPKCNYKISRPTLKRLMFFCYVATRSNFMMRCISFALSFGMKRHRRNPKILRERVSIWGHSSNTN